MARHILQLEVPRTFNSGVLLLKDISIYTPAIPVMCSELQILPPGFNQPAILEVQQGFDLVLNGCTMGILPSTSCADGCPELPDGVWWFQYTVSPSNLVYVQYDYLRTVRAWNRLNSLLCDLPLDCTLPDQQLKYDIGNIALIREYLEAAQTYVNVRHEMTRGIDMYRWAVDLMDKMEYEPKHC